LNQRIQALPAINMQVRGKNDSHVGLMCETSGVATDSRLAGAATSPIAATARAARFAEWLLLSPAFSRRLSRSAAGLAASFPVRRRNGTLPKVDIVEASPRDQGIERRDR
jgi:hypothetical protein